MRSSELLAALKRLGRAHFETRDVAALMGIPIANANVALARLSAHGLVVHLAKGRWAMPGVPPFLLPEALATPFPTYLSLFTALHHHGLIEQIPAVVYAVTTGRTGRRATPVGTISLHHVSPAFFFGFEAYPGVPVLMATPEKALVDTLYLLPARSQLFRRLPELELPAGFKWRVAQKAAAAIPGKSRRNMTLRLLEELRTASMKRKRR